MMKTLLLKIKKYRAPLFTSLFVGTSYIPCPPWAVFFCYVPLWLFLTDKNTNGRQAWWGSWLSQFFFTLIGFNWIAYLVKEFAFIGMDSKYTPLFWIGGIICQLLFATAVHLYIPLASTLGHFLSRQFSLLRWQALLLQAILLSLAERIWPAIFPWHLGYTLLWADWPLAQLGEIVGFAGLSTWILLVNAFIAWWYLNMKKTGLFRAASMLPMLGLIAVGLTLNFWGQHRKSQWEHTDQRLYFHIIQGNIGNTDKVYAEKGLGYQDFILDKYIQLSRESLQAGPQPDMIIWPETAYPDYLSSDLYPNHHQNKLNQFLKRANVSLLTGAFAKQVDFKLPGRPPSVYNSLFLLNSEGRFLSPPYNKTHLVAFSEYFPFSNVFPILLSLPFVSNFGRGPGPSIMTLIRSDGLKVQLGAQICYEGLYTEFSRELSEKGAEIFVNVTNDSWFGHWAEPYQHLTMTVAKSIEMRRPLIRATNTGISTAATATGELLKMSPLQTEWYGAYDLPYQSTPPASFYVSYGHWDWLCYLAVLFTILFIGFISRSRARES